MSKIRLSAKLTTILLIAGVFSVTAAPVLAKGGSAKGNDVWWYKHAPPNPDVYWKAIIYKTGSGIVHEWRYEVDGEPCDIHMIYKPVEKFPKEHYGKGWVRWTYDDRYIDLSGDQGADLVDFFTKYTEYWVHINHPLY